MSSRVEENFKKVDAILRIQEHIINDVYNKDTAGKSNLMQQALQSLNAPVKNPGHYGSSINQIANLAQALMQPNQAGVPPQGSQAMIQTLMQQLSNQG